MSHTAHESSPINARDTILSRIRNALPMAATNVAASYAAIPHAYERIGILSSHERLALFLDRLLDYDTEILQIESENDIPNAIAHALELAADNHLLADPAFPKEWLPQGLGLDLIFDTNLSIETLDHCKTVVTTCEAAIASTGTLILVHREAQGRRIITLLPDHHICLVRRNQIFELPPQAFASLDPTALAPITTISGPSATSDIEMTRIRGVHGPRRLIVVLYGPLPPL